jgi:enamine deaminase RidA (YjgF/YER057c/UK114 family)
VAKKQLIYAMPDTTRMMEGIPNRGAEDGIGGPGAQCYRAGNLVWIAGQTGLTLDGEMTHPYDIEGQTRQACENIKQLMEMAGGTMDDIVRYVTYVTDRAYRFPMGKIFKSYFKMPPCGTGLIIDGLARPDMLVEIDCWAYIDDPD